MSEYYGVASTPTEDFIAHYGIKGMKWGVRRAMKARNEKVRNARLTRQYLKASKKLDRLNAQTDMQKQSQLEKKYNKAAKVAGKIGLVGASVGLAGTGLDHSLRRIHALDKQKVKKQLADIDAQSSKVLQDATDAWKKEIKIKEKLLTENIIPEQIITENYLKETDRLIDLHNSAQDELGRQYDKIKNDFNGMAKRRHTAADIGRYAGYIGGGVGALGLGAAAITKGKALAAKYRTTAKGHAKAVTKRDAFKNAMAENFKGTKYKDLPDFGKVYYEKNKKKIDKRKKRVDKIDKITNNIRFRQKHD